MTTFFDTNVLVYAQLSDQKSERAREALAEGGLISVQVLNEFTNVLRGKFQRSWPEIEAAVGDLFAVMNDIVPLTPATHAGALELARDHGIHFYDALIVAAASEAGCTRLYSEDMQHDREISGLRIVNPFLRL